MRDSERDPCDDAGGHVRAPIERTARAIERGPQPTRIADCCFARAARAARSDRHLHWFAFATASNARPEMLQPSDPRGLRARMAHLADPSPSVRVAWG